MKKNLNFNEKYNITIENEALKGLQFRFVALQADGSTPAVFANPQNIDVHLTLLRGGRKLVIWNSDYQEINAGIYNRMKQYGLNLDQGSGGEVTGTFYFGGLELRKGDQLILETYVRNTAFTSLSTVQSSAVVESIPLDAYERETTINVLQPIVVGNTNIEFRKNIGDNVMKIVAVNDYGALPSATTKAKPSQIALWGRGLPKRDISGDMAYELNKFRNPVIVEDQNDFNLNVFESPNGLPVHNVDLEIDYTDAVDSGAKILVLRKVQPMAYAPTVSSFSQAVR